MSVEKDIQQLKEKTTTTPLQKRKKTLSQEFDELESKYRIDKPKRRRKQKPYRQPIQVVYEALLKCQEPMLRYEILNTYNTQRVIAIFKELIKTGMIMPTDVYLEWVITDKGRILLDELDMFLKKYPFLLVGGTSPD
jgi:hypothetical protein